MARGMNHVRLVGTIATTPELRYTPAGLAVLDVLLGGHDHVVVNNQGGQHALPWYHQVRLFGAQAERYVELPVGAGMLIEGRLDFQSLKTDSGENRRYINVVGLRAELIDMGGLQVTEDAMGKPRLVAAVNEITLIGHLIHDAQVVTISDGQTVAAFAVSLNERFHPASAKEDKKDVHFVEVRAWNNVGARFHSTPEGTAVWARGRLATESWTDADGNYCYRIRVEALRIERIAFLEKVV